LPDSPSESKIIFGNHENLGFLKVNLNSRNQYFALENWE
jgi:hypothetical protein